jgi:hypothetical protein
MDLPPIIPNSYSYIFSIENLLRFSIHNYHTANDSDDYFCKEIFPPYIDDKISGDSIEIIKSIRISDNDLFIKKLLDEERIHKIWLLDYSILISLLNHFWESRYSVIFLKSTDKEHIISRLRNSITIRNAVAHNRLITNFQHNELKQLLTIINTNLKPEYSSFYEFAIENNLSRTVTQLVMLLEEIKDVIETCLSIRKIHFNRLKLLLTNYSLQEANSNLKLSINLKELIKIFGQYNSVAGKPGCSKSVHTMLNKSFLKQDIEDIINQLKGST